MSESPRSNKSSNSTKPFPFMYLGTGFQFLSPNLAEPFGDCDKNFDRRKTIKDGIKAIEDSAFPMGRIASANQELELHRLEKSTPISDPDLSEEQLLELRTSLRSIRMFYGQSGEQSFHSSPIKAASMTPKSPQSSPRSRTTTSPRPSPGKACVVSPTSVNKITAVALQQPICRSPRTMQGRSLTESMAAVSGRAPSSSVHGDIAHNPSRPTKLATAPDKITPIPGRSRTETRSPKTRGSSPTSNRDSGPTSERQEQIRAALLGSANSAAVSFAAFLKEKSLRVPLFVASSV